MSTENSLGIPDSAARAARLPRSQRRLQLLDAALCVFVEHGYHSASMDEIAERAGVSKPVLYQHFPGKLELYLTLLERATTDIIEAVRAALTTTNRGYPRVEATVGAFFDYVSAEDGAFRLVFESDLTSDSAVRHQIDRVTTECAEMISDVLVEATGLSDERVYLLALSLVGAAEMSARSWLASGSTIPVREAAELIARLAWSGIEGYVLAHSRD